MIKKLVRLLAGEVEKLARLLTHNHTNLKVWHAFGKLIRLLARKNKKLARFWYIGM